MNHIKTWQERVTSGMAIPFDLQAKVMQAEINELRAHIKSLEAGELPEFESDDRQWLSNNPDTDDIVAWIKDYARKAIAADRAKRDKEVREVGVPIGWRFKKHPDGSIGIFSPPWKPGEPSRRTSDLVPARMRDLCELLGQLADQQAAAPQTQQQEGGE